MKRVQRRNNQQICVQVFNFDETSYPEFEFTRISTAASTCIVVGV